MPGLPRVKSSAMMELSTKFTVTAPTFFTMPGDESFVPTVAHPGEDAGADIRAHSRDNYSHDEAVSFYREFESWSLKYGTRLYVDGEVFTSESENDFIDVIEQCGGAVFLQPGETTLVHTGFKVILPTFDGLGAPWNSLISVYKIVPRSGLAHKHRIVVTNSPGIIDSGYRDWVKVSLTNNGENFHVFTHGSRIAQGLCEMVIDQSGNKATTDPAAVSDSARSTGGFGSTKV